MSQTGIGAAPKLRERSHLLARVARAGLEGQLEHRGGGGDVRGDEVPVAAVQRA